MDEYKLNQKQGVGKKLTSESERVDVFTVIGAGHELLAKANGVLALCDTIKDFEVLLRDALYYLAMSTSYSASLGGHAAYATREVHLHAEDSDIGRTRAGGHW
jgi:hypothetical protein